VHIDAILPRRDDPRCDAGGYGAGSSDDARSYFCVVLAASGVRRS
jgi:hypothetical protein